MKLNDNVKDDNLEQVSNINIAGLRQRVISLFDLQFILVLGRDKYGSSLTYGELVNVAEFYTSDYQSIAELWGSDSVILRPISIALSEIKLFEQQIENGSLDAGESVTTYAQKHEEKTAMLIVQIMKSLNGLQFLYDASRESVKNYKAMRGRNA